MDIATAKRQFLEYIEIEKGRSLNTVRNYEHYLDRSFTDMGVKKASDITEDKLREFRLRLNRASGVKVKGQSAGNDEEEYAELLSHRAALISEILPQAKHQRHIPRRY